MHPLHIYIVLRKVITYSLLILFSLVFSYETITYFSKKIYDTSHMANDYEAENDAESDDENEKKDPLEDWFFHNNEDLEIITQLRKADFTHITVSSSDYSQTIYSPPEVIIL